MATAKQLKRLNSAIGNLRSAASLTNPWTLFLPLFDVVVQLSWLLCISILKVFWEIFAGLLGLKKKT